MEPAIENKAEVMALAELLDGTRWASDFTWLELVDLASYMRRINIPPGEMICHEGRKDRTLYIIVSGQADVMKQNTLVAGPGPVIATLGPGHTLGEMSLIDGEPRSASVRARSALVLLALTSISFAKILAEKPKLGVRLLMKISWLMSQRIRSTSGLLADVLSHSVDYHAHTAEKNATASATVRAAVQPGHAKFSD